MRRALTMAMALLPAMAGAASPVTAIKAGRLLDVANEKALENVVIVVENGRVREIGTTVPAGATVIDLGRHHVLPGFIDGHTHVLLQGDATTADYDTQLLKESLPYRALRATRAMRIALEHGFTTLRDIGNEGAGFTDVDLKRAVRRA
jgi:imidazolonepropionase-like amidohydrolase